MPRDPHEIFDANTRQVGGEHYRAGNSEFQHWDLMAVNHCGYFEGQVTKYIGRWKNKNGVEDIEKAIHYLEKMIELITVFILDIPGPRPPIKLLEYKKLHDLDMLQTYAFKTMLTYTSLDDLRTLQSRLEELRDTLK